MNDFKFNFILKFYNFEWNENEENFEKEENKKEETKIWNSDVIEGCCFRTSV